MQQLVLFMHAGTMRTKLILFIVLSLYSSLSYAEQHTPTHSNTVITFPTTNQSLKHTKSGHIDKVIDGLTILLKDGDIIRLSSISTPQYKATHVLEASNRAFNFLKQTLPEDTEIMMYQTRMAKKGRKNRMGHSLAHVVRKKDKQWLQGQMLLQGKAYMDLSLLSEELALEMKEHENKAISNRIGIWSQETAHKVQSADNVKINQFSIVEGDVRKVATVRNNVYLNFGDNWKTDFTVMIKPRLRKKLASNGIGVLNLAGKTLRIRGWSRNYNGPLIELDTPEHLQIITPLGEIDGNETLPEKD